MRPQREPAYRLAETIRALSGAAGQTLESDSLRSARRIFSEFWGGGEVDEFGMDERLVEFLRPLFQFLYYKYFRVEAKGARNVPHRGPVIIVANHAGALPYDGAMLHLAVFNRARGKRGVRFLVDDFACDLPLIGEFIQRVGGVRASQESASRLLAAGHAIAVFPEGVRGIGKTYDERYRLKRFGRGGFVRLAMRTGAPIVPAAIVGSEEVHPIIWKSKRFAEPLGVPFIPFTPTFPWLGPLGLVPLPSKWRIEFARPVSFSGFRPADAENQKLVDRTAEGIKREIQRTLDRILAGRKNAWI